MVILVLPAWTECNISKSFLPPNCDYFILNWYSVDAHHGWVPQLIIILLTLFSHDLGRPAALIQYERFFTSCHPQILHKVLYMCH